MRGTHESVLAEAQGARIIANDGRAVNHLNSLRQAVEGVANRVGPLTRVFDQLKRADPRAAAALQEQLRPVLDSARQAVASAQQTEQLAQEFRLIAPNRLAGVLAAAERSQAGLVSSQLAPACDCRLYRRASERRGGFRARSAPISQMAVTLGQLGARARVACGRGGRNLGMARPCRRVARSHRGSQLLRCRARRARKHRRAIHAPIFRNPNGRTRPADAPPHSAEAGAGIRMATPPWAAVTPGRSRRGHHFTVTADHSVRASRECPAGTDTDPVLRWTLADGQETTSIRVVRPTRDERSGRPVSPARREVCDLAPGDVLLA